VLLSRSDWTDKLLDAVGNSMILPSDIDASRRQRMLGHGLPEIRQRAEKFFAATSNVDRLKLVDTYRPALAVKGDAAKGAALFKKTCAACHQLGGMGSRSDPTSPPKLANLAKYC